MKKEEHELSNFQALALYVAIVCGVAVVFMTSTTPDSPSLFPSKTVEAYARQTCDGCSDSKIAEYINHCQPRIDKIREDRSSYIYFSGIPVHKDTLAKAMKNEKAKQCIEDGTYSPVYNVKGHPMTDKHGNVCMTFTPLAGWLTELNVEVFKETGHELKPLNGTRPPEQQCVVCKSLEGSNRPCAEECRSFHFGLAIDFYNWKEIAPFLMKIGMVGGCSSPLVDDYGHFSLGEFNTPDDTEKMLCEFSPFWADIAKKYGKDIEKKAKELYDDVVGNKPIKKPKKPDKKGKLPEIEFSWTECQKVKRLAVPWLEDQPPDKQVCYDKRGLGAKCMSAKATLRLIERLYPKYCE